ncbi:MAG TPA: DUF2442 domain-containing protein [Tichowtungia sp.]|nr:DUF2442 domain-containing protein [Tichowtungia sp.]
MLEVTNVKYISAYTLWLSFSDGAEGSVDLSDSLWGPMFEPLKDRELFKQVFLSPVLHTAAWPNDADFAPEYLREKLNKRTQPVY